MVKNFLESCAVFQSSLPCPPNWVARLNVPFLNQYGEATVSLPLRTAFFKQELRLSCVAKSNENTKFCFKNMIQKMLNWSYIHSYRTVFQVSFIYILYLSFTRCTVHLLNYRQICYFLVFLRKQNLHQSHKKYFQDTVILVTFASDEECILLLVSKGRTYSNKVPISIIEGTITALEQM